MHKAYAPNLDTLLLTVLQVRRSLASVPHLVSVVLGELPPRVLGLVRLPGGLQLLPNAALQVLGGVVAYTGGDVRTGLNCKAFIRGKGEERSRREKVVVGTGSCYDITFELFFFRNNLLKCLGNDYLLFEN